MIPTTNTPNLFRGGLPRTALPRTYEKITTPQTAPDLSGVTPAAAGPILQRMKETSRHRLAAAPEIDRISFEVCPLFFFVNLL